MGFDVAPALDEGLGGHSDNEVWAASSSEPRFLVTQDLDFSDVRRFQPGMHEGIFLIRLPDQEPRRISDFLVASSSCPDTRSWRRCFVVAAPTKGRVLRPPAIG
jgi:predicted nuclease of predicted toxin-antitoxin system